MTDCEDREETPLPQGLRGFLIVGLGVRDASGPGALPPLPLIAGRLAERLHLSPLEFPSGAMPDRALATLLEVGSGLKRDWLAPLPVDPGMALPDGSCWAQTLGAWRQPVVLVISAEQLASGLAAAGTALLRQCGVPLLGLLQWGEPWNDGQRRGDGLPWLGLLASDGSPATPASEPDQESDAELSLDVTLALGWRRLDLS